MYDTAGTSLCSGIGDGVDTVNDSVCGMVVSWDIGFATPTEYPVAVEELSELQSDSRTSESIAAAARAVLLRTIEKPREEIVIFCRSLQWEMSMLSILIMEDFP